MPKENNRRVTRRIAGRGRGAATSDEELPDNSPLITRRTALSGAGAVALVLVGAGVTRACAGDTGAAQQEGIDRAQREREEAMPPFQVVSAQPDWAVATDGETWILPAPPTPALRRALDARPRLEQVGKLAASEGGVHVGTAFNETGFAGYIRLRVVLRGTRTTPVRIQAITARVERRAPFAGCVMFIPPQGESPTASLALPLDAATAEAQVPDEYTGLGNGTPYLRKTQLTISRGETVTLQVLAHTSHHSVGWRLAIVPEGGQEVLIGDGDKPWHITGPAAKYAANYKIDLSTLRLVPASRRPW